MHLPSRLTVETTSGNAFFSSDPLRMNLERSPLGAYLHFIEEYIHVQTTSVQLQSYKEVKHRTRHSKA